MAIIIVNIQLIWQDRACVPEGACWRGRPVVKRIIFPFLHVGVVPPGGDKREPPKDVQIHSVGARRTCLPSRSGTWVTDRDHESFFPSFSLLDFWPIGQESTVFKVNFSIEIIWKGMTNLKKSTKCFHFLKPFLRCSGANSYLDAWR